MVDLSLIKQKDLWYVIGMITTDGSLSIDKRHINITSKDRSILIKIKRALKLKNKIGLKASGSNKEKIYSNLQIGDKRFYNFLLSIGLMPKKSLILKGMDVPKEYFSDFLRGVIDGDGSISKWVHRSNGNVQWSLRVVSGSKYFLRWLKIKTENKFNVRGKLYGYQYLGKNFIYILKFGKFPAKIILSGCYYKNCLSLNRKLQSAINCIKSKDGLSKYGNVVLNQ